MGRPLAIVAKRASRPKRLLNQAALNPGSHLSGFLQQYVVARSQKRRNAKGPGNRDVHAQLPHLMARYQNPLHYPGIVGMGHHALAAVFPVVCNEKSSIKLRPIHPRHHGEGMSRSPDDDHILPQVIQG